MRSTWESGAPSELWAHCTIDHPDYVDHFRVERSPPAATAGAEFVARAFGLLPTVVKAAVPVVQHDLMRLPVRRRSSIEYPIGWSVVGEGVEGSSARWVRLASAGRLFEIELVGRLDGRLTQLGTFIRYRGPEPVARTIWRGLRPLHGLVGRWALGRAARRVDDRDTP